MKETMDKADNEEVDVQKHIEELKIQKSPRGKVKEFLEMTYTKLKSEISKCIDIKLLNKIVEYTTDENVISLCSQRLKEIGHK